MKKLFAMLLALMMMLSLAGCGTSAADTPIPAADDADVVEEENTTDAAAVTGGGKLDEYYVKITGAHLGKDYEGADVIILDYDFTNNGEEATSALTSLYFKLFQDGVELETAIVLDDSDYDSENSMKDIKSGVTLSCQCAYVLGNTTSPVEIEVSKAFSFSSDKITYDIEVSSLT